MYHVKHCHGMCLPGDFILTTMDDSDDSKMNFDDTSLSEATLYFDPLSMVNERACASFEIVQDTVVEAIEEFSFKVNFMNPLDSYFNDQRQFTIAVEDDDGM